MISVVGFKDYKEFLRATEAERSSFQRGFRSRLAEFLGCQNAYISQVLNTHANFSLEQALKIAMFLGLNELESRYFLILVEQARAGTQELRAYFEKDLRQLRDKHLDIKERVSATTVLSPENQSIYYSNWLYPTVHVIVTIPEYRTVTKISQALRLSENTISEVVLFLLSTGLISEKNRELLPGNTQIHLGKQSPHIRQHHTQWRIAAIQSLAAPNSTDIHYSTVSSLSQHDVEILRQKLVEVIQGYVETVKPSNEEVLWNFNLDFYSLIGR